MTDSDRFGQRLRKLRLARGLSVKEIAAELKVATSTYRDWEYGRKILGQPYVILARALGVSLEELLSDQTPDRHRSQIKLILDRISKDLKTLQKELASY